MDLSNSLNVAAMRLISEAAERVNQVRAVQQRTDAGRPAVNHGKGATTGRSRRVRATEAVDPSATSDKVHRQDADHLVNIIT